MSHKYNKEQESMIFFFSRILSQPFFLLLLRFINRNYRVLVSVCVSVCLSVYTITQNGSIDLKLEHIVVYENSSDEFDIGHCPIKVKVMA